MSTKRKNQLGLIVLLTVVPTIMFSSAAYADPFTKLGRGITNVVTAPGEIVRQQIIASQKEDNELIAFAAGGIKGVGLTVGRALGGVVEILTFASAQQEPLLDPPTVFAPCEGAEK